MHLAFSYSFFFGSYMKLYLKKPTKQSILQNIINY